MRQLFRTRSLDAILSDGETPQHQLRRSLGELAGHIPGLFASPPHIVGVPIVFNG